MLRHKGARIAQLVEQRIENPRVGGSNPSPGTIKIPKSIVLLIRFCWTKYVSRGDPRGHETGLHISVPSRW